MSGAARTGDVGRSLPLRVPIADGEALDSWIERLARRSDVPMRHLLPAFGEQVAGIGRTRPLLAMPAAVLRRIEQQTGLVPGRLDDAVLGQRVPRTWRPVTGSRYCPACLVADGIWPLAWRLRWTFACTRHRVLLVEYCPGCGLPPRQHITTAAAVHPSGTCTNRLPGRYCHTDLTAAAHHELASGDPRLSTQRWINQRLRHLTGGDDAVEHLTVNRYDVIVLDRDLPGVHGDEVCRRVVAAGTGSRALMLTAASTVRDRVEGLGLGADDYLPKPFDFAELVARVRALGRRSAPATPPVLSGGDVVLDPARRVAHRAGRRLELSPKEFAVLECLLAAGGRVVSAEELLERAWDEMADPFTTTVKTTIRRLRGKLGDPPVIRTVPGGGYQIGAP